MRSEELEAMGPREPLITHDELRSIVEERSVIEVYPESGYGSIVVRGLDVAVRKGQEQLVVEMRTNGEAHRGVLVTGDITPGSKVTVKNSGGKFSSAPVASGQQRVISAEAYQQGIRNQNRNRKNRY